MPEEIKDVSVPNNKILVSVIGPDPKSSGGLIIDHRHHDKFKKGVVVLAGPGELARNKKKTIPMLLAVGDIVLFDTSLMKEVNINCKSFYIFDEPVGIVAKIGELNNGEIELYVDTKL